MGKRIDLFGVSTIGDKNRTKEYPIRMGKKEKWKIKVSNVSYKKQEEGAINLAGDNLVLSEGAGSGGRGGEQSGGGGPL